MTSCRAEDGTADLYPSNLHGLIPMRHLDQTKQIKWETGTHFQRE
jgi:hypothetical protein